MHPLRRRGRQVGLAHVELFRELINQSSSLLLAEAERFSAVEGQLFRDPRLPPRRDQGVCSALIEHAVPRELHSQRALAEMSTVNPKSPDLMCDVAIVANIDGVRTDTTDHNQKADEDNQMRSSLPTLPYAAIAPS